MIGRNSDEFGGENLVKGAHGGSGVTSTYALDVSVVIVLFYVAICHFFV